uniref:DUF1618 domain-containing protein n=1 Tax=Aegilops tauschii subsp. strangulata TaxID=200361 RepID=A0A453E4G3_AEGTS
MSLKGYHEASLHPPAAYDAAAAATVWDWGEALLDKFAYMVHKKDHQKNHTSARCTFKRNLHDDRVVEVEMQVSLFLAPPPRVSYFCCSANLTEDDHGEQQGTRRLFVCEPWVIATEGNLALLALCHGYNPAYYGESNNYDYFLYEAAASPAGTPKLTCLPQIQPEMLPAMGTHCFSTGSIAVVRYSSNIPTAAHKIPLTPPTPILSPVVALPRPQSIPFTPPPLPSSTPPSPHILKPAPRMMPVMPTGSRRSPTTTSTPAIPDTTSAPTTPRTLGGDARPLPLQSHHRLMTLCPARSSPSTAPCPAPAPPVASWAGSTSGVACYSPTCSLPPTPSAPRSAISPFQSRGSRKIASLLPQTLHTSFGTSP